MAKVTLLQPTDMSAFPGSMTTYSLYKDMSEIYVIDSVPAEGWAALEGTLGSTSTITRAFFDDADRGMAPNLLIEGLTFIVDNNYYSNVIGSGNLAQVLSDMLAGSDMINGSSGADYINGFGGNDLIHGAGGADIMDGNPGNDTLFGDAGNDLLGGGAGRDVLIGGPGADVLCPYAFNGLGNDGVRDIIRYTALTDSRTTPATRDVIFGFIKGPGPTADRIDLSPIDADPSAPGNQAFHLVTHFTAAKGEVRLAEAGGNTIVQVDGGNGPAIDMTILVQGVTGLHAFDLIL